VNQLEEEQAMARFAAGKIRHLWNERLSTNPPKI
jgi:hypothetical protein